MLLNRISLRSLPRIFSPFRAMSHETFWRRVPATGSIPEHSVYTKDLEKGDLDTRDYRIIKLQNGLQALLIHDAEADKAAAAMDVSVGHLSDPDDMPGLAHFCEHLLFMGTEKYPKENEYSQFISSHGGRTNAYTATSDTCYYFSIGQNHLEDALDRFSGFFYCPKFEPSCTVRELNAVDSEHKKNAQSDTWRLFQLSKSLSLPGHPWSKFGTGSRASLTEAAKRFRAQLITPLVSSESSSLAPSPIPSRGASPAPSDTSENDADGGHIGRETRRRLIEWWENHYCASLMNLAILGRESLDELTRITTEKFSPIVNRGLSAQREVSPWGLEQKGNFLFVKTVMDYRMLQFSFPVTGLDEQYESKPAAFVSHFIGHEGPGSLHSYLKQKGWITYLGAGAQHSARGFGFMRITLILTTSGLENYKTVVDAVYSYLSLLRSEALADWNFEEFRRLSEIRFRFAEKESAERYVSKLSEQLSRPWARERLLSGSVMVWEQNHEAVRKMIHEDLAPESGTVVLTAKDFSPIKVEGPWVKEKWYGTEYKQERIPSEILEKARLPNQIAEIYLPKPNEFLPSDLSVERRDVAQPLKRPNLIRRTPVSYLWFKKDDQFWVPKGSVNVSIRSPLTISTPKMNLMTKYFTSLVTDSLTEYSYDASLAGLEYEFDFQGRDINLSVSGYSDKLHVLIEDVLEKISSLVVSKERFEVFTDQFKQQCENFQMEKPSSLARYFEKYCLQDLAWTPMELLNELPYVTPEDVQKHITELFSRACITTLVTGNFQPEEAIRLQEMIEKSLGCRSILPSERAQRNLLLPHGSNFVYSMNVPNPKELNNAISYHCQIGDISDVHLRARVLLLEHLISEPFFNVLRTKEQLGYLVHAGASTNVTSIALGFHIQSERPATYLESRIDAFLREYKTTLESMEEEDFERQRKGLVAKQLERLDNWVQESSRFLTHINSGYFEFTRREINAENIGKTTLKEVQELFINYIHPDAQNRAKISIHLSSQVKPTLNFSVAASKVFLAHLKEHKVPVDEPRYHELSKAEPSVEAVKAFWAPYLGQLPMISAETKAKLLSKVEELAKAHPTEEAIDIPADVTIDATPIKDLATFKQSLVMSAAPIPVFPLEVEAVADSTTPKL